MQAQKADFEIIRMTRLLEVFRSGYYEWASRCVAGSGPQVVRRTRAGQAVRAAHENSDGVDGAPRITAVLARDGLVVVLIIRLVGLGVVPHNRCRDVHHDEPGVEVRVPQRQHHGHLPTQGLPDDGDPSDGVPDGGGVQGARLDLTQPPGSGGSGPHSRFLMIGRMAGHVHPPRPVLRRGLPRPQLGVA